MTTYRELIARRDDFEFMSVSWKGVNSLIQEYLKAQIIAGHPSTRERQQHFCFP